MKKTRKERQEFLDRVEKKYKEKLLLQQYKDESEHLHRQLVALRGVSVDKLYEDDTDLLEIGDFRPSYS